MPPKLVSFEDAVHQASEKFILEHFPEETDFFEIFWSSACSYLRDLIQTKTGWKNLAPELVGLAEPSRDWVSPLVLMTFACMFSKLPIVPGRTYLATDIQGILQSCAKRYGASHTLIDRLRKFAPELYKVPELPELELLKPPSEKYKVIRNDGKEEKIENLSWEEVQELRHNLLFPEKQKEQKFDLVLDLAKHVTYYKGNHTALHKKQRDLLAFLLTRKGDVCTKSEILRAIGGIGRKHPDPENIKQPIHKQKSLLCDKIPALKRFIKPEEGGYKFTGMISFCIISPPHREKRN